MNAIVQLAIIVGFTLAGAGGSYLLNGAPEKKIVQCDKKLIRPDEICLADVSGKVLWVDARPRSEWEENGLKGSILWNMDPKEDMQKFEAEAAMQVIDSELVVVYCSSEACGTSRQIADRIRAMELGPPVKALRGGWDALSAAGAE